MRSKLTITISLVLLLGMVLSACAPTASAPTASAPTSAPAAVSAATQAPAAASASTTVDASQAASAADLGGMNGLIDAAKKEGKLTVITLPRDWCNYGPMMDDFSKKYGIEVTDLNPDGGSADEIEAIKANKDNKGPQAPDVLDIGLGFGPTAKSDGLLAPYKVATWDTIPDNLKDAEGNYFGDYYGVLSFMVNSDVVKNIPQDWTDLLKPDYKNQVALTGDPRVSNQAYSSVFAAGLANGGSLDNAQPGLDFFAKLNQAGNLLPLIANNGLVAKGETPVRITWDYLALAGRDSFNGNPKVEIIVPKTGRLGGVYLQAISKYAPHPAAARLWEEYLYSDEGQLAWLTGYCHPVRQSDMDKRGVIPADLKAKLPSVEGAVFPTLDQVNNAKDLVTKNWDKVVGLDIKKSQ